MNVHVFIQSICMVIVGAWLWLGIAWNIVSPLTCLQMDDEKEAATREKYICVIWSNFHYVCCFFSVILDIFFMNRHIEYMEWNLSTFDFVNDF